MTTYSPGYKSNRKWSQIITIIQSAQRFVFSTHADPDGDGLGSELALARWLKRRGKTVDILNPTPMNGIYDFLDPEGEIQIYQPAGHQSIIAAADAFIIFDIGDYKRLGEVGTAISATGKPVINIDHHPGDKTQFSHSMDDPTACATGVLVYDLIRHMDESHVDIKIAEPLYTALVNDTGNFRFNNTNAEAHAIAMDLLESGVEPYTIYVNIYEQTSRGRVELLKYTLENLQFSRNGELAWSVLTQSELDAAGATPDDLTGLSDFMRSIQGVEIGCSIVALENEPVKISLRSKGKYTVNDIAAAFDGGGHAFAAGAQLDLPVKDAVERVVNACLAKVEEVIHAG
ncbi:MAG: DHH family phosphoesterase [Lentisphaeria bacterium]|nr:DHH family phosphoesterase [Candidatus Neomarinimicrobiota bacterium]MCF7841558.1 DHH family phosphoesterase [Lentisphaeria bacterium]